MDLDFVRIECEILTASAIQITAALYSAVRNFEGQCKAACCPDVQENCTSCSRSVGCQYRVLFAQQLSSDPEVVRLHQKPSLPFAFYISESGIETSAYTVGMVVIGSAVNHIDLLHTALLHTVEAGLSTVLSPLTYALRSYSLDYQGALHEITPATALSESVILLSGQYILHNTLHSDTVRLTLKSPMRLLSNGSIAHTFDFGSFFRAQLRRCSSLCAYYGTGELDLDFARLSECANNVSILDDAIHYAQPPWSNHLKRAGLTGMAECTGLIEPMSSLLRLGSYFNAGKGATFGLGFHQIEIF